MCIRDSYHRCRSVLSECGIEDYEFIFVDDGSPDNSIERITSLRKKDSRIQFVQFSRNFGHHKAIMTALEKASGDLIFLIDSDLEEPPEDFPLFLEKLKNDKLDVVFGRQKKRKGGFFEKLSGFIYYYVVNFFSDTKIPHNFCTCLLYTSPSPRDS